MRLGQSETVPARNFDEILEVKRHVGALTAILVALVVILAIASAVAIYLLQRLRAHPKSETKTDESRPQRRQRPKYGILKYSRIYDLDRLPKQFVILDIEKTGSHHLYGRLLEVGIIRVNNGKVVDRFSKSQPKIDDVIHEIHARVSDIPLVVGFGVESDLRFLHVALAENGLEIPAVTYYDVQDLVRETLPRNLPEFSLEAARSHLGIATAANRAVTDCDVILEVLKRCLNLREQLREQQRIRQEQLLETFNDHEKRFVSALREKLREREIPGEIVFSVLSDRTIHFALGGKQLGRVKLNGRKFRMQIPGENQPVWLDIEDVEEAIGNLDNWINHAASIRSGTA